MTICLLSARQQKVCNLIINSPTISESTRDCAIELTRATRVDDEVATFNVQVTTFNVQVATFNVQLKVATYFLASLVFFLAMKEATCPQAAERSRLAHCFVASLALVFLIVLPLIENFTMTSK